MSRSNQEEILDNPCKKFLKWKTIKETIMVGEDEVEKIKGGTFVYFDKEKGEKGENVEIKLPLKFAILNQDLVCFKGYDEKNKRGVWSNEVKNPEHVVHFRAKDEKLLSFKKSEYKANKDTLAGFGGKYTQSVYIAVLNGKEWEIWNLQLSGSALTGAVNMETPDPDEKQDGWFNFTKAHKSKLYTNYVEVAKGGYKPKKKGTSKFVIPVYTLGTEIEEADSKILNELDEQLNEYLAYYFKRPDVTEVKGEEAKEHVEADSLDY